MNRKRKKFFKLKVLEEIRTHSLPETWTESNLKNIRHSSSLISYQNH